MSAEMKTEQYTCIFPNQNALFIHKPILVSACVRLLIISFSITFYY